MSLLPDDLPTLASLCGGLLNASAAFGPLALAMFLAGAAGSVTHCAVMCGPLVLAQVAALPPEGCARARITAGARLPYHLGRLTTYGLLGAVAGVAGHGLVRAVSGAAAPIAILLGIAAIIAAHAAWRGRAARRAGTLSGWLTRMSRPLLGPGWSKGVRLGLLLGLLPCGMIYAALSVAAASASPWRGAVLMLAFGAGTLPGLVSIGTVGRAMGIRLSPRFSSLPMAINAGLLALLALRAWMSA